MLVGGLARLVRRCTIPGGQGRDSHHCVPECREPPAKLRAALKCRLGRRAGRGRLTPVCQCQALTDEAGTLEISIVSRLGLGRHLAELCDGSGQIAAHHLRRPEIKAALARVEPVADRVGEVASFLTGRAHRDRVTRGVGALRLQGEDLAEPPPIVHGTGQADRLGEACPGHLGVIALAGDEATGGQCPGQQGRVIDVSRAIARACSA